MALAAVTGAALVLAASASAVTFVPKADFAAGTNPHAVAVGDFNADGVPDLAVANLLSFNASVLLGLPGGGFAAKTDYSTGFGPSSVAVGDFNGDGDQDLVVANSGSDSVTVLLGVAGGGFGGRIDYAAGPGPSSVAVGDFNGDGDPDLAVADSIDNTVGGVTVLLGQAGAGFAREDFYAAGNEPASVAVGDFDADGRPDLAIANADSGSVSVLLRQAGGGFAAAGSRFVGNEPTSVAVADFNADGDPDLAVANRFSANVSVLLGSTGGTFAPARNINVGSGPISVAIGDFNKDGDPDLAVANNDSDTVSVLLGSTGGAFVGRRDFLTGTDPISVAVGDFDADSKDDLVVANDGSQTVSVLINTSDVIPPDTTITGGPTGLTDDSTPTFSFTSDEAGSSFQCRVDSFGFGPCASPSTTGALSDGAHTFYVRAVDPEGNNDPTPASQSFTVDAPPQTTIDGGPSGVTADSTPTFSFSSNDTASSFECRIDSLAFADCDSPHSTAALSDGAHTFEVRATDATGHTDATPASRTFTVDTTAPQTTIDGGPSGVTADSTPTFSFSSDESGSSFECRVDDEAFATCSSPLTTMVLSDGGHSFEVRATDATGHNDTTPASRTFTVDTTAPQTTIDSGPTGVTADSTPTFSFSSDDAEASFECGVDGGTFAGCSSPHTMATLSDGAHTFEVRATDTTGNTDATPASRTFTVDTTAPQTTIDGGPTGTTADSTPTFSFSSDESGSSFECRVDTEPFASCFSPLTTAVLNDGSHSFEVRATDAAGHTDATAASRSFTVQTVVPDTTPPSVSCSATPPTLKETTLKANNHKLITVGTSVTVIDEIGGSGGAGFKLLSVTSSQADSGLARDDVAGDIQGWATGTADTSGLLRQERYSVDRVYTLTYEGRDNAGNTATCRATVTIKK